jgi:hypothetical protein
MEFLLFAEHCPPYKILVADQEKDDFKFDPDVNIFLKTGLKIIDVNEHHFKSSGKVILQNNSNQAPP